MEITDGFVGRKKCEAVERASFSVDVDVKNFEIREKCEFNKIIDYWINLIGLRVTIPSTIAIYCTFPLPLNAMAARSQVL